MSNYGDVLGAMLDFKEAMSIDEEITIVNQLADKLDELDEMQGLMRHIANQINEEVIRWMVGTVNEIDRLTLDGTEEGFTDECPF